ncbi:MAG: glycoside hydrolase family 43 protein [Planctomycetota bacterium]|jgi:arabinan endo-1,5-alpha-L-arabinosidase|nr:glycoside hydrolase family 43 protein [Planctomycetota bacterium]
MSLTWSNPIIDGNLADPFILNADGRYWLIATAVAADGRYLPIYVSDNCQDWKFVRGAVERGAPGAWNRYNFWAPEILHYQGQYWLYYTAKPTNDDNNAGNRVGLAVSDSPAGPYQDCGVLVDHASLDASPFCDADGQLWLYYVTDHGSLREYAPGKIWVDRLLSPSQVADEAKLIVERHGWQEGPVLWPDERGRYRLTFSLGCWKDDSYHVAQAVADRPDGPFVESDSIILRSSATVKGPGHHNFFTGPDGATWIVYHGWDLEMTGRKPRIDPINAGPDGDLVCDGPSSGAVTLP